MKISFNVQHTYCRQALIWKLRGLFSDAAITTNSHYYTVYTYQFENWDYGFFLMAKNHMLFDYIEKRL